ncbi:SLC13 family permease [Amycolatopsis alkalitolerans]|nr:SLC13 family permease [Amycolatopsis alkalitolerans]
MTAVDLSRPATTTSPDSRTPLNTGLRWAAGITVGLVVWFIHIPDLNVRQEHGAALILATIVLWLLRAAPQGVVALLFVVTAILSGVSDGETLLRPSWTSSQIWFVFASFGFGYMIADTSLGERLTSRLLRYFSRSFWSFGLFAIVSGTVFSVIGMAGDFARVGILYPVIAAAGATMKGLRREASTRAMAMMILGVGQPTLMYVFNGFWLNQTFLGLAQEKLSYVGWFTHFMVPSLAVSVLGLIAIRILFAADIKIPADISRSKLESLGRLTPAEWRTMGFIGLAIALWLTSSWTGLDAGWIALSVFVLMLLPGIGVMNFQDFTRRMNWNIIFFLTGAFALGALIKELHLAPIVEHWLVPSQLPNNPFVLGIVASLLSMLIHLFTGDAASAMAVTVPVFHHAAVMYGLNPLVYGFVAYMSIFSQYFFLYQAAGVLFAYGYGLFTQKDIFKFGLASVITTSLGLGVVGVFYWQVTGMLH